MSLKKKKRDLESLFDELRELKMEEESLIREIEETIFDDDDNYDNYDDEEDI